MTTIPTFFNNEFIACNGLISIDTRHPEQLNLITLHVKGRGKKTHYVASCRVRRANGHTFGVGTGSQFATRAEFDAYVAMRIAAGMKPCICTARPGTEDCTDLKAAE